MKILLAHGSSDSRHAAQLDALARAVSELLDESVGTACLSDAGLPEGATVLPLFLGEGKHVYADIPKLTAASDCMLLPPLAACADQLAALVLEEMTRKTRRINAVFALYRFGGFEKLTAALYARAKICSKHALASLHSEPSLESALQHWQQEGVNPISLQPMLLFEGRSMDRLRRMAEPFHINIAPVLSEYGGFAAVLAARFRDAA